MADKQNACTLNRMSQEQVSRQERKRRTRQALLDAALHLLADREFGSLSLREVAKQAGVVPTAFYRHFTSLDDLGVALVEESMRTLRGMLRADRGSRSNPSGIIRASVATLHRQVRANTEHFHFLVSQRYGGSGPVSEAVSTELRLFGSELAVDLARFEALREWSTEDLRMLADLIVTAMLGTVLELLEVRAGDTGADAEVMRGAEKRLRLIVLGVPAWRSSERP